jgi:predicted nucleic acid-binding Zn ribbon protein
MEYQPGVCNIGRDQRRKRRTAGLVSLAGAAAVVVGVLSSGVSPVLSLASAPFFFGAFVGLFQDYFGFCVAFAALARYDLSGSDGGAGSVTEREAVRRDRRRAVRILVYAALAAAVATAAAYGLAVALV